MATDRAIRPAHRPQTAKPTGLDWDAVAPTCSLCGQGSSELRDGLCPLCRGVAPTPKDHKEKGAPRYSPLPADDVERVFTAPAAPVPTEPPPSVDVPPGPRSAVEISEAGPDEPAPSGPPASEPDPDDPATWAWSLPRDVDHVAQVLVRAADSTDPVARLLRLNVLSAAESLYLYLEHQRYAQPSPLAVTPDEALPTYGFETPQPDPAAALAEAIERPLDRAVFEGEPEPAPDPDDEPLPPRRAYRKGKRVDTETAEQMVRRYVNGESAPSIAADVGCSDATVYNVLRRLDVPVRPKGTNR